MNQRYGMILVVCALLMLANAAKATPLSFSSAWGGCTVESPGMASINRYPVCSKTKNGQRCSIFISLDGVGRTWTAFITSRPLKGKFTGMQKTVPFGDSTLSCSLKAPNVTAIRHCRGSVHRTGGRGSCEVCTAKNGKQECAIQSLRLLPDKVKNARHRKQ